MRRRSFLRAGMLAGTAALCDMRPLSAKGTNGTTESFPIISLAGAPRERGRTHGEQLRETIQAFLGTWQVFLSTQMGAPANAIVANFLGQTRFTAAIEKWTPGLLDEVRGIAEGAAVDFDTLLAFNLPDELTWYGRHKQAGVELPEFHGCTSLGFAAASGRPTLVAQNMDIASGAEGFEVLLHLNAQTGQPEAYLFSLAGMIGIVGMNAAPLAMANNSLHQLQVRTDGLPINFLVRGLLAQSSLTAALDFLLRVPHATGQNYILGDSERVVCYECSANKKVEFRTGRFPGAVYHTNHPFVNEDRLENEALMPDQSGPNARSSRARCTVVEKHIEALARTPSVEAIRSLLSSQEDAALPVSRPHSASDPGATYTAACLIMEMGMGPALHIAPGPPGETPFQTVVFERD